MQEYKLQKAKKKKGTNGDNNAKIERVVKLYN